MIYTSSGEDIPYDSLAITAGPWTNGVCFDLGFPQVPVSGGPGHMVQIQAGYIPVGHRTLPRTCLFAGVGTTLEQATENLGRLETQPWYRVLTDEERKHGLVTSLQLFPRVCRRMGC